MRGWVIIFLKKLKEKILIIIKENDFIKDIQETQKEA